MLYLGLVVIAMVIVLMVMTFIANDFDSSLD
jgi:hypothetical protein